MANDSGSFIWYELMARDPVAARAFYADVIGWSVAPYPGQPDDGSGYQLLSAPDGPVGGLMRLPDAAAAAGAGPRGLGYLGVDDVDATAAAIAEAGGAVHMPPTDLPGVGRMAVLTDPQGAPFYVMRGATDGESKAFSRTAVGHCGWNELSTSDQAAAKAFYTGQFGWTSDEAMSMGAMGDYAFLDHAGVRIGAMMTRPPEGPPPGWLFYFRVPDVAAALDRVRAGGGSVVMEPVEVPGGEQVAVAIDPEGAGFGLVAGGSR